VFDGPLGGNPTEGILRSKMAEKPEVAAAPVANVAPLLKVDPLMEEMFLAMGYSKPFPRSLVMIHNAMKLKKDKLNPGRLSPEALAIIGAISDLFEGKFNDAKE